MSKKKNNKNKGSIFKTRKPTGGIKNDEGTCHYYGKENHYRRNYKDYLTIVKAKKFIEIYASCVFMVE
jgi:hypothetical protein